MGCDTHGIIKQRLSGEQVFEAVQKLFDPEAKWDQHGRTLRISDEQPYETCKLYNEKDSKFIEDFDRIWFKYNGEDRGLFYDSANYYYVDEEGKAESWYAEFEHTWFDLGYWGNSVEIMEKLVAELGGGWVQSNDCGSKEEDYEYHEVASAENPFLPSTETIIALTYDELCKKLGGTVVITDRRMGGV